jgi:hypothetical protein
MKGVRNSSLINEILTKSILITIDTQAQGEPGMKGERGDPGLPVS